MVPRAGLEPARLDRCLNKIFDQTAVTFEGF